MKSQKLAISELPIGTDPKVTYHVVPIEKVAEQHILTECSKCNSFQVTSDLLKSENLK